MSQTQVKNLGSWPKGAIITHAWDFTNMVTRKGTTLSSVAWSTEGSAVTVAAVSVASNVATSTITAAKTGCAIVKCLGTMADADEWPVYWKIEVVDPECGDEASDYGG